ncbi:MAG TPA: DUF5655 domain-containing protein [Anaerolineales bacterium]|nr:DUF5655 domain-containing protein [Anaerolineales bacterium]
MAEMRDWQGMNEMSARLLLERTGEDLKTWNERVERQGFSDEKSLRAWLTEQGVTGYAQSLLVMEQFGYPEFMLSSADELIEQQYADRPGLKPIFDALVAAAARLGEVTIQARKTYVSLVTPRRTFVRIQPTTQDRIDLGLRIDGQEPGGRLKPSTIQETMRLQIGLKSLNEVDDEVLGWLQIAYEQNK